jgi:rare lipoprotein A
MENGLTKVSVETIVLQNDQKQSIPVTQKDSSSKTQSVVIPVKDSLLKDSLPSRENLLDGADSVITGLAGIYSAHSEGAKMANGGIFHHKKLTAAANQFKLNSWVKLTNFKNNKTVILKITDRVSKLEIQRGFVIELSQAAAKEVDINSKGYQMVKLEKLKR